MDANDHREELSRQSLIQQVTKINNTGRAYLKAAGLTERRHRTRDHFFERHHEVDNVTLREKVEYVIFLAGLVCIYGIDIMLFGAPAQYLAGLLDGGIWADVAKYLVPAFFLGIEILIAMKIAAARHAEQMGFGSRLATRGWITLGVLVALVMPLSAAAVAQSVGVVTGDTLSMGMVVVLAIISFAAHVLVLFAGRFAQDAKTYMAYAIVGGNYSRRAEKAKGNADTLLAAFNALFIRYVHAWRIHNTRYAEMPSGPFDDEVVTLLKRQFPQVTSSTAIAARDEGAYA